MEIPESVLMEILSKLPVKSLVRFRCVCKHWYSSFQTSYFITKHLRNNVDNNNLKLLTNQAHPNFNLQGKSHDNFYLYNKNNFYSTLSTEKGQKFGAIENIYIPLYQDSETLIGVHGPCNGLLCIHSRGLDGNITTLWNPSTREFKIIPKSTVPRHRFAASTFVSCPGFGFDSAFNDYKVVRFLSHSFGVEDYEYMVAQGLIVEGEGNICPTSQVELYSLKSDSWKEISVPEAAWPELQLSLFNTYINGFYYWEAYSRYVGKLVLSFDMTNETFSTFPFPNINPSDGLLHSVHLLDYNGLLGIVVLYPYMGIEKYLDLWVMNESWTKQFSIEIVPQIDKPLLFWENGEILISSDRDVLLFDPATKEVKKLGIDTYQFPIQIIAYYESLVSINGRSENEENITREAAVDLGMGIGCSRP